MYICICKVTNIMQTDKIFMERCFQLAQMGAGNVSPNPMVGAVVTVKGKIIGEGYHKKYGFAHAEVNAINSVANKELLQQATIYVSLEPCSHFGKTPPCANLLIEHKIKRCVISNLDPNPKVAGRGIKMLQDAGIEVAYGLEEAQGRFINRRFFCYQEKKRPYIILKIAQSIDGYMDINDTKSMMARQKYWITNDAMLMLVHKMRVENDAFMVGANTVINDDCQLNNRYYDGKAPVRLVYDRNLSIPTTKRFFDNTQQTLIFNNVKKQTISQKIDYIHIDNESPYLEEITAHLYEMGVSSLVVEGGRKTLLAFLQRNLWDEAIVLTGAQMFNGGIKKPAIDTQLKASTRWVSNNRLDTYYNRNAF